MLDMQARRGSYTIRSAQGLSAEALAELWRYRGLFSALVKKQITVRYKQAVVGLIWVVARPLIMLTIFSVIFGQVAKIPVGDIPYPLFVMPPLFLWFLFSGIVTLSGVSLTNNIGVITKVYFPRILLPVAGAAAEFLDFAVTVVLLVAVAYAFDLPPAWRMCWAPAFIAILVMQAVGLGLILAPLNALYRDFGIALPFILQVLMYATPIIYSTAIVPEPFKSVLGLNPLVGVFDGFRWAIVGTEMPADWQILYSACFAVVTLFLGIWVFYRLESTIVDRI
ncbi:ABC transporter permease [Pelagibius sp. CAU 1746]|uniref:ABC transporter permease n=1 Tax=Pelagibius sp. CAU 1746 TaxID=3140370 RepID=UPI00325A783B